MSHGLRRRRNLYLERGRNRAIKNDLIVVNIASVVDNLTDGNDTKNKLVNIFDPGEMILADDTLC